MADSKLSALTATTTLVDADEFYVNDGGVSKKITKGNLDDNISIALSQVNDVTSTAAEVNLLDGSVAGTAVASKALVLGATKNVDTIDITKDGLKIGTVAVTTTAAELNILDGATLSTAELNYVTGVTSSIQTQLDAKQSTIEKFTSTDQTITSGALLTLAHGLSSTPTKFYGWLVCQTGEDNWIAGDEIYRAPWIESTGTTPYGCSVYADATHVYVRFSSNSSCFVAVDKSDGTQAILTNANWKYRIIAEV